ncbi:hypothetical protein [Brevibacillus nitrificans]|uniref:hypothetical protein n=1 Tax=Brevibacillus nitrificans TaxID=651560 RepID=UPI00285E0447|nr:hypothetical protein [Brevibacillus nitrificans]MDR7316053.1 hypothetical protein [Brevibacillus nitrificans]
MGFLKELGQGLGQIAGGVVGGTINLAGELFDNKTLKEVGEGVYHASSKAGETIGTFASGTVDVVGGFLTNDEMQMNEGFRDIGGAVSDTATGIINGVANVIDNGGKVINGVVTGDTELVKDGGVNLLKTAAIATFAVGIADLTGVIGDDGIDAQHEGASDVETQPHWVEGRMTGAEGSEYLQSNPDLIMPNNLTSYGLDSPTELADGTMIWTDEQPKLDQATNEGVVLQGNSNVHHVEPHWRTLSDGARIWVDGDGDTSVNTYGGWTQHNPDFRVKG